MNTRFATILAVLVYASCATARAVVLNDFDAGALSNFSAQATWGGNVSLGIDGATNFATIGGTAKDDGKLEFSGTLPDFSGLNYVGITFRTDSGNVAPALNFVLTDSNFTEVSTSLLAPSVSGVWTTVYASINKGGLDMNNLVSWSIAGGNFAPVNDVRFSIDQIVATSAVPEPSTYAAILGFVTLGLVGYRRFRRR